MNTDNLRALQPPLKDRYKQDAGAAVVTLTAAGSGDMLLEALGGVRRRDHEGGGNRARDLAAAEGVVHAEGELDFRGTLGVGDRAAPVGFRAIRLALRARHRRLGRQGSRPCSS